MGRMKEYYYEQLEEEEKSKKVQVFISGDGYISLEGFDEDGLILIEQLYEREIFEALELQKKKA